MKKVLTILMIALLSLGGIFAVNNYQQNLQKQDNFQNCENPVNFEELSYQEYLIHIKDKDSSRLHQYVTQDNYDLFVEYKKAQQRGDFEEIKNLKQEIGLKPQYKNKKLN